MFTNAHFQPRLIGMIPELAVQFESRMAVPEQNMLTVAGVSR